MPFLNRLGKSIRKVTSDVDVIKVSYNAGFEKSAMLDLQSCILRTQFARTHFYCRCMHVVAIGTARYTYLCSCA